jgi:hypothetical protein
MAKATSTARPRSWMPTASSAPRDTPATPCCRSTSPSANRRPQAEAAADPPTRTRCSAQLPSPRDGLARRRAPRLRSRLRASAAERRAVAAPAACSGLWPLCGQTPASERAEDGASSTDVRELTGRRRHGLEMRDWLCPSVRSANSRLITVCVAPAPRERRPSYPVPPTQGPSVPAPHSWPSNARRHSPDH